MATIEAGAQTIETNGVSGITEVGFAHSWILRIKKLANYANQV
ncbi:MAG: hypothetical protein ACNYZG_05645 [Gammaproteobacteria bacterium]